MASSLPRRSALLLLLCSAWLACSALACYCDECGQRFTLWQIVMNGWQDGDECPYSRWNPFGYQNLYYACGGVLRDCECDEDEEAPDEALDEKSANDENESDEDALERETAEEKADKEAKEAAFQETWKQMKTVRAAAAPCWG